mmetsp:Transcript_92671/g.235655  ORF Transcript_92671/g.235655 Transcript_92671/m.235655 type:complete len:205 (-) Transcript_92671:727-1341(-)
MSCSFVVFNSCSFRSLSCSRLVYSWISLTLCCSVTVFLPKALVSYCISRCTWPRFLTSTANLRCSSLWASTRAWRLANSVWTSLCDSARSSRDCLLTSLACMCTNSFSAFSFNRRSSKRCRSSLLRSWLGLLGDSLGEIFMLASVSTFCSRSQLRSSAMRWRSSMSQSRLRLSASASRSLVSCTSLSSLSRDAALTLLSRSWVF